MVCNYSDYMNNEEHKETSTHIGEVCINPLDDKQNNDYVCFTDDNYDFVAW